MKYLSIDQVAELLGCCLKTLRRRDSEVSFQVERINGVRVYTQTQIRELRRIQVQKSRVQHARLKTGLNRFRKVQP